jgi:putative intracellular protease/amidase
MMKILMVLTSHEKLGDTGVKTGFWLEELAAPYYVMKEANAEVTLVSPEGGQPPLDPKSADPMFQTDETRRFAADKEALSALENTLQLTEVDPDDFDGVFYPGGHGPLWDLAENQASISLIEKSIQAQKPVALVCHAPGVLRHVKNTQGEALVKGKQVTGFANTEEEAVELTKVVPFLVEDMLKEQGAIYTKSEDWNVHVVSDDLLITGQNPGSSTATAQALLKRLQA